jgi:SAM-dependent methyltransferase
MTIKEFTAYLSSQKAFTFQHGIWYSSDYHEISYPTNGHNEYYKLEEDSFWFKHRNNCITSLVKKYAPAQCFFDVGGGNGFVTRALTEVQVPAVLIEPGKQAVINAQKRNLENIFCGTLSDLNGLAGRLNSIGTFDLIEHIQSDKAFIKEVNMMLEKGGYFFVTVPAYPFLWSHEDTKAGHFKRYDRKTILKLLNNNNFDVIYATYFFSFLVFPVFFFRTLPTLIGIRNKSKNRTRNEHKQRKGFFIKLLEAVWEWEFKRIQKQKPIPFGSSLLLVAIKR